MWFIHNNLVRVRSSNKENLVQLKLLKDQSEYVDSKGIHVVVGHYLGEESLNGQQFNLTDELLNTNAFDPKPNEGKNGQPVIIPSFLSARMHQLFHINRFNLMASDRIPLDRNLPDVRKKSCLNNIYQIDEKNLVSVVIVFHNEAWSTLLRTVTSVINRSPKPLLKEIILVDDASSRTFLKDPLDEYVSKLPVQIYVIHSSERNGLVQSRLLGARKAKGSILVFLDAHCECSNGWLESLVSHVAENRTQVACPVIDIISDETFAYIRSFERHLGGFNWDLHFRWYTIGGVKYHRSLLNNNKSDITKPFKTPVMAGGLFAIDREYFFEIGSYDDQMKIWGGENLEMSFRVWQCGGSINIVPCSHVGHLFRKSSPYRFPGGVSEILYSNLVRVALVWMDEWANFYFKFHPEANRLKDEQPVRARLELRQNLKCRDFKWYLENVWPQQFIPMDGRFFGKIRHFVSDTCLEKPTWKSIRNQPTGLATVAPCSTNKDLMQMFVMAYEANDTNVGSIATDESVCLDISSQSESELKPKVHILACSGSERQKWVYSEEDMTLRHLSTNLCAEIPKDDLTLVLNLCTADSYQKWKFESILWK